MYFDEFYVALPFIEKSLYDNGRDIRSYVILNEIFTELLTEKRNIYRASYGETANRRESPLRCTVPRSIKGAV